MAFVFAHRNPDSPQRLVRRFLVIPLFFVLVSVSDAATYTLAIEPSDSPSRLQQLYRPLADYLSRSTGETFEVQLAPNFLAYWQRVKKGGAYDFIIDSAHMTDYRIKEQKFVPLMRGAGNVTYSVVTLKSGAGTEAKALVGKNVASLGPPSMPYLLFHKLYPNPLRQPKLVPVEGASAAIDELRSNNAIAAVIPSQVAQHTDDVIVIAETEAVPNLALSASPTVPAHIQARVVEALNNASSDPEIVELLDQLGISEMTPVDAAQYQGQASLLEGMWGF
ncbi:MAG: PhnD/SsuA/transferrin family substrate-binding protein [Gammaproteobacteria bacterium]|nr:PhnD/SsuA/transferrin family substrate-binding protein [Gammaproteobacteria bacterium]